MVVIHSESRMVVSKCHQVYTPIASSHIQHRPLLVSLILEELSIRQILVGRGGTCRRRTDSVLSRIVSRLVPVALHQNMFQDVHW